MARPEKSKELDSTGGVREIHFLSGKFDQDGRCNWHGIELS
jgi:hypothetical protein